MFPLGSIIFPKTSIITGLSYCNYRSRQCLFSPYYCQTHLSFQHPFSTCDAIVVADLISTTTTTTTTMVESSKISEKFSSSKKSLDHKMAPIMGQQKKVLSKEEETVILPSSHVSSSKNLFFHHHHHRWNFSLFFFYKIFLKIFFHSKCTVKKLAKIFLNENLLLSYLIIFSYWPSLFGELVFDDRPAIIDNHDIRPSTSWLRIWFDDYWGTSLKSPLSHKSYRPLTVLTFRLNYFIHQLHPFGYHFVNLLLHIVVTILFKKLCQRFLHPISKQLPASTNKFGTCSCSVPSLWHSHQSTPFILAAIFAVHPIHTDCVASVVGRAELLSAIFYLLSLLVWDSHRQANGHHSSSCTSEPPNLPPSKTKNVAERFSTKKFNFFMEKIFSFTIRHRILSAIILALLGFLSKEQSIFSLLYLSICQLIGPDGIGGGPSENVHRLPTATTITNNGPTNRSSSGTRIYYTPYRAMNSGWRLARKIKIITLLGLVFFFSIIFRFAMMDYSFPTFNRFDNPASRASFPVRQLSHAYIALYHFWLLLYPWYLSCDWTHSSIELIDFDPEKFNYDLVRLILVLTALFGLAIITVIHLFVSIQTNGKQKFLLQTSSSSLSNALRARSGIPDETILQRGVMSRKLLKALALTVIPFLPVSNLFFFTGFVVAERVMYLPSMGFILLVGIGLNNLFQYFSSPDRRKSNDNQQQTGVIITSGIKTRRFDGWKSVLIYLSIVFLISIFSIKSYQRCFDWSNEFDLYRSGLQVNPRNTKLLNNLGRIHEKNNRTNVAIELYREAIKIEPKDLRGYLNLGNILIKRKSNKAAERIYRQALKQVDDDLSFHNSVSGRKQFNVDQLNLSPMYLTVLIRLAELIQNDHSKSDDLKRIHDRIVQIQTTLLPFPLTKFCDSECIVESKPPEIDPNTLDQLYNLGVVHYRQGHLNTALGYFEQVLALDPHHESSLLTSARIILDENIEHLNHLAVHRLEKLVQLGKADAAIYFDLARLAVSDSKFHSARNLFSKAISERESFAEAHYNLALLLVKEMNHFARNTPKQWNHLREAIYHLERVLMINPKHENSMFVLGEIYAEELNQYDRSQYYYRMILDQVNPANIQARYNLCVLWRKRANIDKSIQCFQRMLADRKHSNNKYFKLIHQQIEMLLASQQQHSHRRRRSDSGKRQTRWSSATNTGRNVSTLSSTFQNESSNNMMYYKLFLAPNYLSTMCFI